MKLLAIWQLALLHCVENQVATESALRAIAGLCQDNTTRTVKQGTAIKSLQAQTDSILTRLADVKEKTDSNTRHTAVATRNINSLQADQSTINNQLESIKARKEKCAKIFLIFHFFEILLYKKVRFFLLCPKTAKDSLFSGLVDTL
jgi:hypothetical protein